MRKCGGGEGRGLNDVVWGYTTKREALFAKLIKKRKRTKCWIGVVKEEKSEWIIRERLFRQGSCWYGGRGKRRGDFVFVLFSKILIVCIHSEFLTKFK